MSPKRRPDILDTDIVSLYCDQDLSCMQTSRVLRCDRGLIKGRLKKLGIPLKDRTMSEHVRHGVSISVELDDNAISFLDGEMLGDGHLSSPSGFQAYFSESVAENKKEWLEYIMNKFSIINVPMRNNALYFRNEPKTGWCFTTQSTIELGNQHRRWYKYNEQFDSNKPKNFSNRKYIKYVPQDVKLDSISLLHWYIGDGSNKQNGTIKLCTQGFSFEETEFLRLRLYDLGIKTSYLKEKSIGLSKTGFQKLVEIMGDCPVECYKYKWNFSLQKHYDPRNSAIDAAAVDRFLRMSK